MDSNTMAEMDQQARTEGGTFATAILCMDGRIQHPVSVWVKEYFHVNYVDMITLPGADGVLALGPIGRIHWIRESATLSVEAHHSRAIAVVGHHDCAGNLVSKDVHLEHIARSVKRVASWGLPVRILGLWLNEHGKTEVICDLTKREGPESIS